MNVQTRNPHSHSKAPLLRPRMTLRGAAPASTDVPADRKSQLPGAAPRPMHFCGTPGARLAYHPKGEQT
jgi:hypothetical protein